MCGCVGGTGGGIHPGRARVNEPMVKLDRRGIAGPIVVGNFYTGEAPPVRAAWSLTASTAFSLFAGNPLLRVDFVACPLKAARALRVAEPRLASMRRDWQRPRILALVHARLAHDGTLAAIEEAFAAAASGAVDHLEVEPLLPAIVSAFGRAAAVMSRHLRVEWTTAEAEAALGAMTSPEE